MLQKLAQTAVACISLTLSIVDGRDYNGTYIRPGIANASNLECYSDYFNHGACGGIVASQALAHAYGDLSQSSECGPYTNISEVLASKNNYEYYCKRTRDQQEFAYRFNEYNPADINKAYPRFTNRTITASSGKCLEYSVVGIPTTLANGDLLYIYKNDTYDGNITIPGQSNSVSGTTWIYRGTETPENAVQYACGPRCIIMWAHRSFGYGESSAFFECPITVNHVENITHDGQAISNNTARLAAASIALQGQPSETDNGTHEWTQYQFYAFG